jgi:hypothetical protein
MLFFTLRGYEYNINHQAPFPADNEEIISREKGQV